MFKLKIRLIYDMTEPECCTRDYGCIFHSHIITNKSHL